MDYNAPGQHHNNVYVKPRHEATPLRDCQGNWTGHVVTRGQLVPYTITLKNKKEVMLRNLNVVDTFPPGFKFVAGSSRMDGQKIEPAMNTRQIVWSIAQLSSDKDETHIITKTRRDDFIQELTRIDFDLRGGVEDSPIGLDRGLDTMLVVAAAHLSEREARRVRINYQSGYRPEALLPTDLAERSLL